MEKTVSVDWPKLLRGLLLSFFAVFLIRLVMSGEINFLVAPVIVRFVQGSIFLAVVLAVMTLKWSFAVRISKYGAAYGADANLHGHHHHVHNHHHQGDHPDDCDCGHHHMQPGSFWSRVTLSLFVLSLAVAFTWHPKALGTEMIAEAASTNPAGGNAPGKNAASSQPAASSKADTSSKPNIGSADVPAAAPLMNPNADNPDAGVADQQEGTDSQASIAMRFEEDPSKFWGKPVSMDGFVYHPAGLPANCFILTRFFVFCCIADAAPYGITVQSSDAQSFKSDTWVHVTGVIQPVELPVLNKIQPTAWYPGHPLAKMPAIAASTIKPIKPPASPYMFPR